MNSSTLNSILLDGGAGYNIYTTKITYPEEIFSVLSTSAKTIIRLGSIDSSISGFVSPSDLIPLNWDKTQRKFFYGMSTQEQIDVCAFVTSIVHELCHHLDLLRTPFGASLHEKLCREFMAFERWMPTLLECPTTFFSQPLVDWALSKPSGAEEAQKLQKGSPLEQALVELRGSIAFDEVRRGTMPRHVEKGWAGNTNPIKTLPGKRIYEKVTINKIWSSICLENDAGYLSPNDIIEGRTLALCLIYLFHLLGEDTHSTNAIRNYINHFYKGNSTYLTLLEIHAGSDIDTLLNEDIKLIKRRLWEAVASGWYALNSPIAIEQDDILQCMTARCVLVARVMRDTDLLTFSKISAFLSTVDNYYAEKAAARPIEESLQISAERLNLSISICNECRDPVMQRWYKDILQVIRNDLFNRILSGYDLGTGLPKDGNPINWMDDSSIKCFELSEAPKRVNEWYQLRQFLLTKRGGAERKVKRLRDFFSYLFL